jgi:hypothetical protein
MTMTGANHAVRPKCPVEIQLDIHVTVRAAHLATQGRCHAGAMIDAPRYEAQHCVACGKMPTEDSVRVGCHTAIEDKQRQQWWQNDCGLTWQHAP